MIQVQRTASFGIFALVVGLASSCLKGPGFMKQNGEAPPVGASLRTVVVASVDKSDGSTSATLVPSSDTTQVIEANKSSTIAGASVSFPPGAVPGVLDVSLSPTPTLVPVASETAITDGIAVVSEAPAVAVTAGTIGVSADADFSVTVPLPSMAGLTLVDPFANVVVLYAIDRDGQTVVGAYLRTQIAFAGGYATVLTRHFGKFQAVVLQRPLEAKKEAVAEEKPAPAPQPEPPPPAKTAVRFVPRGFVTTAYAGGENEQSGFFGSLRWLAPGRSGTEGKATSLLRSER